MHPARDQSRSLDSRSERQKQSRIHAMATRACAISAREWIRNSVSSIEAKRPQFRNEDRRGNVGIVVPARARTLSAIEVAAERRRTQHATSFGFASVLPALLVPHKLFAIGLSRGRSVGVVSRSISRES